MLGKPGQYTSARGEAEARTGEKGPRPDGADRKGVKEGITRIRRGGGEEPGQIDTRA